MIILDKITDKTLIRFGGLVFYAALAPLAISAICLLPLLIIIAPLKSKSALRCFDELANAFWFNGSAYESLSSHAWRKRETWWGKFIIWITEIVDKDHCERANNHEQKIVDYVVSL